MDYCNGPLHDIADLAPEMHDILCILDANADLTDDPRMDGMTDCYVLSLDDIEAVRDLIGRMPVAAQRRPVSPEELEQT